MVRIKRITNYTYLGFNKRHLVRLDAIIKAVRALKNLEHPHYVDISISQRFNINDNHQININSSYSPSDLHHTTKLLTRRNNILPGTGVQLYYMKKLNWKPQSYNLKDLEVKAFPWYYPTGKYGLDYDRPIPLKLKVRTHPMK